MDGGRLPQTPPGLRRVAEAEAPHNVLRQPPLRQQVPPGPLAVRLVPQLTLVPVVRERDRLAQVAVRIILRLLWLSFRDDDPASLSDEPDRFHEIEAQ